MKRRKKIKPNIKQQFRVPPGTQYAGLKTLLKDAGLVTEQGTPTEEGRKALAEQG